MKKNYHLIGIGGIGMGGLASLLIAKGHRVSGSDLRENQLTQQLKEKGAEIYLGHEAQNITEEQIVVYSSAVTTSNVELDAAYKKELIIMRRAELLAELMKEQIGITVAGAHGKTTTTSLVGMLLTDVGLEPTVAVGGIVNETSTNAVLGDGKFFVAEVDESDGSFLNFTPKYSIITNIDLEHLDYYPDWKDIIEAYDRFIRQTKEGGIILAYGDDKRLLELLNRSGREFKTYGFSSTGNLVATNIVFNNFLTSFNCIYQGEDLGRIELPIPGNHNVANALACILLGLELGLVFEDIAQSLKTFKGVQRRFQRIGEISGVTIIDDYAHHPTEIKTTLQAAQQMEKGRVIAIFQPHRYSRFKSLWKDFLESLNDVDYLIVSDVYAASEEPIEGISAEDFVEEIGSTYGCPVKYLPKDRIVDHLLEIVQPEDLVITLGAGDIKDIAYQLYHQLEENKVEVL